MPNNFETLILQLILLDFIQKNTIKNVDNKNSGKILFEFMLFLKMLLINRLIKAKEQEITVLNYRSFDHTGFLLQ